MNISETFNSTFTNTTGNSTTASTPQSGGNGGAGKTFGGIFGGVLACLAVLVVFGIMFSQADYYRESKKKQSRVQDDLEKGLESNGEDTAERPNADSAGSAGLRIRDNSNTEIRNPPDYDPLQGLEEQLIGNNEEPTVSIAITRKHEELLGRWYSVISEEGGEVFNRGQEFELFYYDIFEKLSKFMRDVRRKGLINIPNTTTRYPIHDQWDLFTNKMDSNLITYEEMIDELIIFMQLLIDWMKQFKVAEDDLEERDDTAESIMSGIVDQMEENIATRTVETLPLYRENDPDDRGFEEDQWVGRDHDAAVIDVDDLNGQEAANPQYDIDLNAPPPAYVRDLRS
ncbi:hypothetical protein WICPIJ_003476 [Wickerhamomyces pijperi]|uniref:Uncharacterized protein n=1 Tax=Wickerhamomyces pijperi TaxID=599730 RepID=A0A9P8TNU6_WICPI|nr:hypothetical protein WICPIJ_003476 [Wickerhamomyces pijperi]